MTLPVRPAARSVAAGRSAGPASIGRNVGPAGARPIVLVTRRIPPELLAPLGTAELRLWDSDEPMPREELLRQARGATGLVSVLADRIDAALFDAAGPSLRAVSNVAVGYDNVDVGLATRRGILVTNTPGVLTEATADLTWLLILGACRRLGEAVALLRTGAWDTWRLFDLTGLELGGATLGIVGAGRIGQAVARRAQGFDMRLIYTSRAPKPAFEEATGAAYRPLDTLLGEADVVTLHVPLTPETHGLIGARELDLMKPTAVLVNTSRGPVVDEKALAAALASGRLFAAGLDVYEKEPLPMDSPLRALPNALLLPHVGSATIRTRTNMARLAVTNLAEALKGRLPKASVNPEAWAGRPG